MPPLPWLDPRAAVPDFPAVETATREPNGLLAAGGRLTPEWLLAAYQRGIFPWYSEDQPILWWSPDPRAVLLPPQMKISRSLAKVLRGGRYRVSMDCAFEAVIDACAAPRAGANGTWITPPMRAAYGALHRLGHAHCVEIWHDDELVGGLYGVAVGRVFFGESMFSRAANASKVALAHLARRLTAWEFALIDCQFSSAHLHSLGVIDLPRRAFLNILSDAINQPTPSAPWRLADAPW